jgi:hypothetical protein
VTVRLRNFNSGDRKLFSLDSLILKCFLGVSAFKKLLNLLRLKEIGTTGLTMQARRFVFLYKPQSTSLTIHRNIRQWLSSGCFFTNLCFALLAHILPKEQHLHLLRKICTYVKLRPLLHIPIHILSLCHPNAALSAHPVCKAYHRF